MRGLRLILQQNMFKSVIYNSHSQESYFANNHVDFEVRDSPQRSSLYWRKGIRGLWNCCSRKMKVLKRRTAVSLCRSSIGSQVKHLLFAVRVLGFQFQFCYLLAEQP